MLGGKPLGTIKLKRGKGPRVTYSRLYEDALVALEYGMSVDAFYRKPPWEQARMVSVIRTRDRIRAATSSD